MNRDDFPESVGVVLLCLALAAGMYLLLWYRGIDPVAFLPAFFGVLATSIAVFALIVFAFFFGHILLQSKRTLTRGIAVFLIVFSSLSAIYFAVVYSSADISECPAGPRYC